MRRFQAILAVLTLVALPLVPLAQAAQTAECTCKRMCACCMGHGMHSGDSKDGTQSKTMYCERHADEQACCRGMLTPQSELRVVLAPIPPTMASWVRVLATPSVFPSAVLRGIVRPPTEFSPDIFEPPRS